MLDEAREEGMPVVLIEARVVDSTHLELSKPIAARKGRTVIIAVAEAGEADSERRQWLAASASSLQAAYSDSEPDYPASMIRETSCPSIR